MGANTGTTVRSATVTISANTSHLVTYMYIDQLPQYFTISNNGGNASGTLLNPFSVSALNAYWANISTNGQTVTFSANANTGSTTRYESVLFTVANSGATAQVRQAGGGGNLSVSPTAITADYTGGDKVMTVQSDSSWSVTSKPNWVTLSQSTGNGGQTTIIATLTENTGSTQRTGTITFSDGTRTATVDLTQNYHIVQNYLSATPSSLTWDYVGGNKFINISSSAEWSATSVPNWVTLDSDTGPSGTTVLSVSASQNWDTTSGRTGTIVFTNGTNNLNYTVAQGAKVVTRKINVTPDTLNYDYTGNTKYLTVSSEDNSWSAISIPNWIVLSQNSGQTGYTMLGVTAGENQGSSVRTGEIIFSDGNFNVTVSVYQPASSTTKTLTVSPSVQYVENTGGMPIITITYGNRNGDSVNVTSSESWVTPSSVFWTGDSGNCVLTVANYGVDMERQATITITSVLDPTLTTSMFVKQQRKPYISSSPGDILFEYTGGTQTITIDANVDWTIDIIDTTNN